MAGVYGTGTGPGLKCCRRSGLGLAVSYLTPIKIAAVELAAPDVPARHRAASRSHDRGARTRPRLARQPPGLPRAPGTTSGTRNCRSRSWGGWFLQPTRAAQSPPVGRSAAWRRPALPGCSKLVSSATTIVITHVTPAGQAGTRASTADRSHARWWWPSVGTAHRARHGLRGWAAQDRPLRRCWCRRCDPGSLG